MKYVATANWNRVAARMGRPMVGGIACRRARRWPRNRRRGAGAELPWHQGLRQNRCLVTIPGLNNEMSPNRPPWESLFRRAMI